MAHLADLWLPALAGRLQRAVESDACRLEILRCTCPPSAFARRATGSSTRSRRCSNRFPGGRSRATSPRPRFAKPCRSTDRFRKTVRTPMRCSSRRRGSSRITRSSTATLASSATSPRLPPRWASSATFSRRRSTRTSAHGCCRRQRPRSSVRPCDGSPSSWAIRPHAAACWSAAATWRTWSASLPHGQRAPTGMCVMPA